MRELAELEGFDVEVVDEKGESVDLKTNGFQRFNYDRRAKSSMTVTEWKQTRFQTTFVGYTCQVLNGDGTAAHGNTKLESVRQSYEG